MKLAPCGWQRRRPMVTRSLPTRTTSEGVAIPVVIELQGNGVLFADRTADSLFPGRHPRAAPRRTEAMIEHWAAALSGRADMAGLQVLESCSSTWIFDEAAHRFRRVSRGAPVSL